MSGVSLVLVGAAGGGGVLRVRVPCVLLGIHMRNLFNVQVIIQISPSGVFGVKSRVVWGYTRASEYVLVTSRVGKRIHIQVWSCARASISVWAQGGAARVSTYTLMTSGVGKRICIWVGVI